MCLTLTVYFVLFSDATTSSGTTRARTLTAVAPSLEGEYYVIHPRLILMLVEEHKLSTEKQLRAPPKFLQTGGGRLHKLLFRPFSFYRFLSKIQLLALEYSNPGIQPLGYGVFEEPKFEVLAAMSEAQVGEFQERIAWLLWEAYDVEWWFILKERAIHRRKFTKWRGFPNVKTDLASFPTTEASFHEWSALQLGTPLLKSSTRFNNGTVEITDPGKLFFSGFTNPVHKTRNIFPAENVCFFLFYVSQETVMKIGFKDTTDTLKETDNSQWGKFGPRRLLHYICQLLRDVWLVALPRKKDFWEESYFLQILATRMEMRSGGGPEETRYILWKTDEERFVRYDRLRPMIVSMTQEPLPTANKRRRIDNTTFAFIDGKKGKNQFFRWMSLGGVQLNDILFGRILMGIHHKFPQSENKNLLSWKLHYRNIKTKKSLNLGIFWHSLERFLDNGKEFTKTSNDKMNESMVARYKANQDNWKYHSDGAIDLFTYPRSVEARMNLYLSSEASWREAIMYAQEGYMTETFLKWLVAKKVIYNLGEPKEAKAKEQFMERAHLDFLLKN
jgi:hypothetical protein